MSNSPLQLDSYFFPTVVVEAVKEFGARTEKTPVIIEPKVKIFVKKRKSDTDPKHFGLSLHISIEPNEGQLLPYIIKLQVVGAFSVSETVPQAYREQVVASNGSQILYGAARDFLLTLTARGPWKPLTLPTIVFSDLKKGDLSKEDGLGTPKRIEMATTRKGKAKVSKRRIVE